MNGSSMRRDPKTGALLFSQSPEAKRLQGLQEDIQNLTTYVIKLTEKVETLVDLMTKSSISKEE